MTNNFDEAIGHRMVLFYSQLTCYERLSNPELPLMLKQQNDFWILNFKKNAVKINNKEQMKINKINMHMNIKF